MPGEEEFSEEEVEEVEEEETPVEVDVDELEGFEEEEKKEEEKQEEKEDKEDVLDNLKKDFEGKLEAAQKEINRLGFALRKASKEEPKTDDEPVLTDAQILAMMDEHQDDKAVMLNIMKYVSRQSSKDAEKKAVDATKVSQAQREINTALFKSYPDLEKEGSELHTIVHDHFDKLFLEDHPLKESLALGALVLNDLENIRKESFEAGKKEALGEKAERERKESIKKNSLIDKGKGKEKNKPSLTDDHQDVIKKLGLSKRGAEMYANFITKKAIVTEV